MWGNVLSYIFFSQLNLLFKVIFDIRHRLPYCAADSLVELFFLAIRRYGIRWWGRGRLVDSYFKEKAIFHELLAKEVQVYMLMKANL